MPLLVVSSAARLRSRYGESGYASISRHLEDLEAALDAQAVFPDDGFSVAGLGLDPLDMSTSSGAGHAIRQVARRLRPAADALLLLGGDEVVPFHRLPNPVVERRLDPDPFVLSDNAYGNAIASPDNDGGNRREHLVPSAPVGRIPDPEPPDLSAFLGSIDALGLPAPVHRSGALAAFDQEWAATARSVFSGWPAQMRVAPGWNTSRVDWRDNRYRFIYFNMHGFDGKPNWQGFDPRTGSWADGVRPGQISRREAEGAVVFAESCYGAQAVGRSSKNSVALAFVENGARGFVGPTGLAFGSSLPARLGAALDNANELARGFVSGLHAGLAIGKALAEAKKSLIDSRGRSLTLTSRKTAMQFVLFGNPNAFL